MSHNFVVCIYINLSTNEMYFVLSVGFGECRTSRDEKNYFKDGREGDYLLLRQVLVNKLLYNKQKLQRI